MTTPIDVVAGDTIRDIIRITTRIAETIYNDKITQELYLSKNPKSVHYLAL